MALSPGMKLGPYEILSPLGAGGMGEVYRARDTKLGREVALKVLPEAFSSDAERMARFRREAQLLASLNHANIAAIYGFEDSGAVRALVMELVEGPTLAQRFGGFAAQSSSPASGGLNAATRSGRRGAIPLDEALPIAKQIAEGLEYAHERGIVHRDLKPANIKISSNDAVKILDFGLAKALTGDITSTDISSSPTISRMATQAGIILGTAAYMSPEQAKGKSVDRRTDIWSFGCVLYEMLAGKMAFNGETVTDTLAAVIRAEPDWSLLPKDTPAHIRVLLQRCLKKDPRQRLRDIGDARIAIEDVLSGAPEDTSSSIARASQQSSISTWRRFSGAVIGLLIGALLCGLAMWKFLLPASSPSSMHFSAITNFAGVQTEPALSPDGRSVAFVSNRDGHYNIYVGLVHGGNLVQVTHDSNLKARPAWSPDGATLAYARINHSGIWDVWEVPALGGTPRRVLLNAFDPAWSPDGHSLAYENVADGALWIAGISGENPRQAVPEQQNWVDSEPRFSPDGRRLAFVLQTTGPYGELAVADLASGKVRQLTHDNALALSPAWSRDGRAIYFASSRGGTMNIWKISADGGEPQQITAGQGDDAELDVSSDGRRLVFSTWRENTNIAQMDLDAKPEQPAVKLLTSDPARNQLAPVYSPDGKHLAYFSNLKGVEREGIWVSNADGSNPLQLVQDDNVNVFPRWTRDNLHLVYLSFGDPSGFRSVPLSGGAPQMLLKVNAASDIFDVGPDGRLIFPGPKGLVEIFDPRNNRTETVATLPSNKREVLRWSSDGDSVAYLVRPSREDDPRAGIWVADFKNPPRQIFHGWVGWFERGPGNELYVLEDRPDLNGVLWKVGWNGQDPTRLSASILLLNSYWENLGRNDQDYFGISPDGRHLAFETQTVLAANIGMIEGLR